MLVTGLMFLATLTFLVVSILWMLFRCIWLRKNVNRRPVVFRVVFLLSLMPIMLLYLGTGGHLLLHPICLAILGILAATALVEYVRPFRPA